MFAFLGKLLGIAIRGKHYLSINFPSLFWKLLVGDTPGREDLEAIDTFQVKSLDHLRSIDKEGVDASIFNDVFFETFTVVSLDNRVVDLVPNGSDIPVLFENRNEYCDLVFNYRLKEIEEQAKAVLQGLSTVVPATLLSLTTWEQLEKMVCGASVIDISLLRSITEYSSCSPNDAHIGLFWQAMEEFSQEERSAFLRFTWGRSRLPLDAASFAQRFKVQSFQKYPPDSYLPIAHTCFFSIELPAYSTLDIMKSKIRYAIFNCQAIDGDDTNVAMSVASMDWDD
jgi:hypothetical protein